jgi:hypothetical protein
MPEEAGISESPEAKAPTEWETTFDALIDEHVSESEDEAPAVEVEVQETEIQEPEVEETAELRPEGVTKALASLKTSGVPDRILESLTDEEASEWWGRQEKQEKDVKAAFAERAELRRKLEEREATPQTEPQVEPTVSADLSAFQDVLTEQLGSDVAKTFVDQMSPLREKLDRMTNGLPLVSELIEELAIRSTKAELRDRFPGLDDSWAEIEPRFRDLAASDVHGEKRGLARIVALMEDAARYSGTGETPRESVQQAPARSKVSNTATAPTATPMVSKKLSGEALADAKSRYIIDNPGITATEVIAHFGG